MPIIKRSEDYIDFIYEAIKKQYDIVISKQKIRKILRTLEIGICRELVKGKVLQFGKNVEEANFVYLSQAKHQYPKKVRKKIYMTRKYWKQHFDHVGFILDESRNRNRSGGNG